MEQSPSWEANRFSASQANPTFYGTRWFDTAFISARDLPLSWATSIQSMPPNPTSWRSILNVIFPCTPGSPKWPLSLRFPNQNHVYASPLPHTRYMPRPFHSSRFYHPNNIGWGTNIIINTLFSNIFTQRINIINKNRNVKTKDC